MLCVFLLPKILNSANAPIIKLEGNAIGTLPTPTREGYDFVGWYADPDFITEVDDTYVMPSHDVTFYADGRVLLIS